LQVVLCSGILYGYYLLVLKNKKFHQYNRFYLLLIMVLSFIIPLLEFTIKPGELGGVDSQVLQNIFIKSYRPDETSNLQEIGSWLLNNALLVVYLVIAVLFLTRLVKSIWKLLAMRHKYQSEKLQAVQLFRTHEPGTPFSFFNWLFWDNSIAMDSDKGKQIFKHELYHIQQKHSWDIMLMELVCMVAWMNPFFHLIRKEQATIHEFLADRYAMQYQDKWDYAELLVVQAIAQKQRLTHPFFHNQIKRRIAMITNVNKTSFLYVRKLLVLPLLLVLVTLFAVNCSNDAGNDKQPVADNDTATKETVSPPEPPVADTDKTVTDKQIPPPPPKVEEVKFTPPKVVKDGEEVAPPPPPKVELKKFTPPRVVKDEALPSEKDWQTVTDKKVYQKVEVEASFPGGVDAWQEFLKRNLNAAIPVDNKAPKGRYTIYVQFIVDEEGNTSNFKAITNHGYGMEKEVLRVLKLAGKWKPAYQNGQPVTAIRKQPVTFLIEEE
jgi:hypothetical protein